MDNKSTGTIQIESTKVRILPDGRMTRRNAALYLGFAEKTIAMWDGDDPGKLGSIKLGGRRFYFKDRLDRVIRDGCAQQEVGDNAHIES